MSTSEQVIESTGLYERSRKPSLLELMLEADPYPHNADPCINPLTKQRLVPLHLLQADFHLDPPIKPMGHVTAEVLLEMIAFNANRHFPIFTFYPQLSKTGIVPEALRCVAFHADLVRKGEKALSLAMEALVCFMRGRGSMKARRYEREDLYSLFADPRSSAFAGRQDELGPWNNVALSIFRNSSPYFGTAWIGIMLIVYEGEGEDMKVWIQKRGRNVQYPGLLDTTAGGGAESHQTPWQAMAKETVEETGISPEVFGKYASFKGALTFYLDPMVAPKPLVHLCFDIKRPSPTSPDYALTQPKVCNEEVSGFVPMSISEIRQGLMKREFQASAVPDIISFLYRKGFITRENEPEIDQIMARCQRKYDVAFPHRLLDF